MSIAMQQAKAMDADLVIATDPDADRVGAAVKNQAGEWQLLNGNQMASLIIYYLLQAWKDAGKLQGKEFVAKTLSPPTSSTPCVPLTGYLVTIL